jgi:hypothetical protein
MKELIVRISCDKLNVHDIRKHRSSSNNKRVITVNIHRNAYRIKKAANFDSRHFSRQLAVHFSRQCPFGFTVISLQEKTQSLTWWWVYVMREAYGLLWNALCLNATDDLLSKQIHILLTFQNSCVVLFWNVSADAKSSSVYNPSGFMGK